MIISNMISSVATYQSEDIHQHLIRDNLFYQHDADINFEEDSFLTKDGHSNVNGEMCGSPESGIECDQPISPVYKKSRNRPTPMTTQSNKTCHSNAKEKSLIVLPLKETDTKCTNNLQNKNGLLPGCKHLFLRRIRSINGQLKSVLMLDADYNVVANEQFLKDREKLNFTPITFSNDSAIRLPHKKRYFFSLSSINELTKLRRKQKSNFKCNFTYSDSDDSDLSSDEESEHAMKSPTTKEHLHNTSIERNEIVEYPDPDIDEESAKSSELAYTNTFDETNQEDTFYASDWDPERSEQMASSPIQETNEIEYNQEFEEPSTFEEKSEEPSTSGLSRLQKLKLDLKRREMELENVRRKNGLIS